MKKNYYTPNTDIALIQCKLNQMVSSTGTVTPVDPDHQGTDPFVSPVAKRLYR